MPDDEGLRDQLAEQAFGVLVAAAEDGTTNWNVVAHAIVGNQLPVVERHAARRAAEALREAAHTIGRDPEYHTWRRAGDLCRARAAVLAADGAEPHPAHRHDETGAGRG